MNGKRVPSREVVVGDILKFTSGDRIGADLRIIESTSLEIEESALTGESVPVAKKVKQFNMKLKALGMKQTIAFMGTMVTRGNGTGIVIATGMETAMGKIADLLQSAETQDHAVAA